MTNLLEIEDAIKKLPERDARQLAQWLQEYLDDLWDRKLAADLESGKLDNLIAKAEADIETNQVRNLDEVLRNS